MQDSFRIVQFDPAESGLLGEWTWRAVRVKDGTEFLMDAELAEVSEGHYTLSLVSEKMEYTFADALTDGLVLQIPLGTSLGFYQANTSTRYLAFALLAPGTNKVTFNYVNAVNTGYYTFDLSLNEDGKWVATGRASDYPDKNFRFEYWKTASHEGLSANNTPLKDIVLEKL